MNPQTQTIGKELIDRISQYDLDAPPSEFEARLFLREADTLKKAHAIEGWMISGIIYSLLQAQQQAETSFKKALALTPIPSDEFNVVLTNYANALRKMAQFDRAYQLIKTYNIDHSYDLLYYAYELTLNTGLIQEALSYHNKLKKLPAYQHGSDYYLQNILTFCNKEKINSKDLYAFHILVHTAIHAQKKKPIRNSLSVNPDNEHSIAILFHIKADAKTIATIEWDIFEKLAESDIEAVHAQKLIPIIKHAH